MRSPRSAARSRVFQEKIIPASSPDDKIMQEFSADPFMQEFSANPFFRTSI